MIRIQEEDFSSEVEIKALVAGLPMVGGVVAFIGTVRDITGDSQVAAIELEHYPGMTESELARIEEAAHARFPVEALLVVHRVGRLTVADNIVLVVAASRHRAAAFDACRYLIDHLKIHATFWKKEILTDNSQRWVNACPGCEAAASQWQELRTMGHTHPVASAPAEPHHHDHPSWAGLRVGILTLSDSRSLQQDGSGDALQGGVEALAGQVVERRLIADDAPLLTQMLLEWSDQLKLDVILTTGGTGVGPRDVTPEATKGVLLKELPGVAELIRTTGLQQTRHAVLSRGLAGMRNHTLIINLPGSKRGAAHGLQTVADLVPHVLRMAHGGGHG
ncbi:MAG: molybdenum cofactor biosynthesis protein MoaE [Magnetococcales bacterium]|nr:molybdenum cofactor biosynthesis protein MoaE [Magnetococcales bacterium]